jgi:hypothetical protein
MQLVEAHNASNRNWPCLHSKGLALLLPSQNREKSVFGALNGHLAYTKVGLYFVVSHALSAARRGIAPPPVQVLKPPDTGDPEALVLDACLSRRRPRVRLPSLPPISRSPWGRARGPPQIAVAIPFLPSVGVRSRVAVLLVQCGFRHFPRSARIAARRTCSGSSRLTPKAGWLSSRTKISWHDRSRTQGAIAEATQRWRASPGKNTAGETWKRWLNFSICCRLSSRWPESTSPLRHRGAQTGWHTLSE